MFRGSMVSVIYASTLKLQSEVYDELKAVTLMTTDIDNIANNILNILEIWARIAEVGIGIWLLERQLGWVCVAPVIVTLGGLSPSTAQFLLFVCVFLTFLPACTYGALKIAGKIGPAMAAWMGAIQKRVGITSSVLASMKSIKMMGLSNTLSHSIQDQRVRELDLSAKFRWLGIYRNVICKALSGLLDPCANRDSCNSYFACTTPDICHFCYRGIRTWQERTFHCSSFYLIGYYFSPHNTCPSTTSFIASASDSTGLL
jgi:hypothetical protein